MVSNAGPGPICLLGDVVRDDGSIARRQYVVMSGGRIQSVGAAKPAEVRRVDYTLADDEMIFPSFLDLHTHTSYNMLPLWHSPVWAWDNRFQWRANKDYTQTIGATNRAIVARAGDKSKIYEAFVAFSELMAIAGGTTVLQENAHLDHEGFPEPSHILIRSTGTPGDMGLQRNVQVASVLEFYEPEAHPGEPYQDTSKWKVATASKGYSGDSYVNDFALSATGTRTRGTIVHVAEGRAGFLQTRLGVDAYTRAEFDTFRDFITSNYRKDDVSLVRDAHLSVIHGCGMDTSRDADTIGFLKTYGIGVIWSPVSNLLLYQDTTNVLPLLDAGVPVALGTDWTPSGSKNVWEEAKFAADFLEARRWRGNVNLTCFRAITSAAADLLRLPLGRVQAGNFADVVILQRPRGVRQGDALQTFRRAGDEDVRAVLVAGVPLYGDPRVLKALGADPIPLPDETPSRARGGAGVARSKAFVLPRGCGITLEELTNGLQAADQIVGKNRPKLLAADDADYLARMAELRTWVDDFAKTGPTPKPKPPRPSGLAPGETEWMYNPSLDPKNRMPSDVVNLLGRMAPCRDERCAVPKLHPFYHAEVLTQAGDSYGFRVPCMPVVPVLTNREQLFVMGDFPTAKFTARSTNCLPVITGSPDDIDAANDQLKKLLGKATAQPMTEPHLLQTYIEELDDLVLNAYARPDNVPKNGRSSSKPADTPPRKNEFFAPVGDLFAPLQDASYFDGYKVRNVAAGVFFQEQYLAPVGVQASQIWLTNMIKCFLFHTDNVTAYQTLGWTDVHVEQSYSELDSVGKVCSQWIDEEVQVCAPKLVVTLGKGPCALLHNVIDQAALQGRVYDVLLGVRLPAHDSRLETAVGKALSSPGHRVSIGRPSPWARYNVFHMMHPQAVMMAQTAVSSALVLAMQMTLGPKADGMSLEQLNDAVAAFVRKHGTLALITALPYGQRDTFMSNATLLERHAVTMADLADTLAAVRVGKDRGVDGDRVLAQQAAGLVESFHLADSASAELKRLKQQRADQHARIAKHLR